MRVSPWPAIPEKPVCSIAEHIGYREIPKVKSPTGAVTIGELTYELTRLTGSGQPHHNKPAGGGLYQETR